MNKVLVILGPTATGKSDLAIKIARKYNGEIISADSRQVYTGLDIGTGKVTKKEMRGIPHHMLDVISPTKTFSVADWKKQTEHVIKDIHSRNKFPIIVGGTGFYIQSVVDRIILPEVAPNKILRKKLEKKSPTELISILKLLDKSRLKTIDAKNPVRLIRAIEIATALGSVPKIQKQKSPYIFLQIGLNLPDKILQEKIHDRLISRIKKGMEKEAKNLHKAGLSWKRMRQLGLEYRYLADLLQNRLTQKEFIRKLETEIRQYAKRQMTWFKRDTRIHWFDAVKTDKITKEIHNFLD